MGFDPVPVPKLTCVGMVEPVDPENALVALHQKTAGQRVGEVALRAQICLFCAGLRHLLLHSTHEIEGVSPQSSQSPQKMAL